MTNEEFTRIHVLLKKRYGIDMSSKKEIVNGRLENFLRQKGFSSYTEFMDALEADYTGRLESSMVDLLTTNHTFFMREPEHFSFLKTKVLPELKQREEGSKDLYIWSAACSSGEEPYTIAMTLIDFFGLEKDKWDTKILATDVSKDILAKAKRGVYPASQIKDLSEHWKRYFFKESEDGETVTVKDVLKQEVMFREFNLMNPLPFRKKMHVVFLRNVMIYFDMETKKRLIQRIYDGMEKGGYLFIGKTETIEREWCPFKMIDSSIYIK